MARSLPLSVACSCQWVGFLTLPSWHMRTVDARVRFPPAFEAKKEEKKGAHMPLKARDLKAENRSVYFETALHDLQMHLPESGRKHS